MSKPNVDQYVTAMTTACRRSKAGVRAVEVLDDGIVTVSINPSGGVHVAVFGPQRELRKHLERPARKLAEGGSLILTTPLFGDYELTFMPK